MTIGMKRRASTYNKGSSKRGRYTNSKASTLSRYAAAPKKIELKHDDGTTTGAIGGGLAINLTSIQNGTGPNERIGSHIAYKNIEFSYAVVQNASLPYANQHRVFLVRDKQCNGVIAAVTDVLTFASPLSYTVASNRSRFEILWDSKIITTYYDGAAGNGGFATSNACGNVKLDLTGKKCEFQGTTSGIASIESGNLLFIVVSNVGASVNFAENNRIQYYD